MSGLIGEIPSRSKIVGSLATVDQGGTGASTFTDGGILLGSGAGTITATAALADSEMLVGDGTTDPAIESGATLRTSIGLGNVTNESKATMLASPTITGTTTFSDGNITNVGNIALDTISSDAGTSIGVTLGTDAGDDFNVGSGKLVVEGDTGNVGIGSATPSYKLAVYASAASYACLFQNAGGDDGYGGILVQCGTTNQSGVTNFYKAIDADGDNVGGLENNGGTFALFDSSDIRLKSDVVDTAINGLNMINQIKIRDFKWKKSGIFCRAGLIANELETVFPEAVSGKPDDIEPMQVSRERIIPILVKSLQELSAKVTALESA